MTSLISTTFFFFQVGIHNTGRNYILTMISLLERHVISVGNHQNNVVFGREVWSEWCAPLEFIRGHAKMDRAKGRTGGTCEWKGPWDVERKKEVEGSNVSASPTSSHARLCWSFLRYFLLWLLLSISYVKTTLPTAVVIFNCAAWAPAEMVSFSPSHARPACSENQV